MNLSQVNGLFLSNVILAVLLCVCVYVCVCVWGGGVSGRVGSVMPLRLDTQKLHAHKYIYSFY